MVPIRLIVAGVALGAAALGGWQIRDWQADAAELSRQQEAARTALRRQEAATGAANTFEEQRDAIRREIMASLPRLGPALAVPVPQCPALEVGAVPVPPDALRVLRDAAGQSAGDPGEPGPGVQHGAGAP